MQKEHFEVILESVDSKMQLLLEGFSVLDRKIDAVKDQLTERADLTDVKIDTLNKKIDAVAASLEAHRTDTESHHGIYRVKEG
jgi:chaperonin cofactor prefoldin